MIFTFAYLLIPCLIELSQQRSVDGRYITLDACLASRRKKMGKKQNADKTEVK